MNPLKRWQGPGGYREVLALAFPMILSTSAWAVQEFVDRIFLARYSPNAIAAATPAGILQFTVLSFFIGIASYSGTFVAQYYGAGRYHRVGPSVWQGLYVAAFSSLVMLLLIPAAAPIFNLAGHVPEVRRLEIVYFQMLCLGAAAPVGSSALSAFFSGRGRPWPVMWVNLLITGVNIILNYVLIFGRFGFPEMGIAGAGLATVISGFTGLLVLGILTFSRENNLRYRILSGWRFDGDLFVRLLRYGLPMGAQFCLDMAGFTVFVLLVGRLGAIPLAATNIALNINMLAFLPMLGAGFAIAVLVGQNLGGEHPEFAERAAWSGFHLAGLYMAVIGSLYVLTPDLFIAPFIADASSDAYAEIRELTVILLRFCALFCVFDTFNLIFSNAIKGAGDTRFVMIVMAIVSIFVLALPTWVAIVILNAGLMTCWVIVTLDVSALGLIFYLRFRGGKWKTMRVIEASDTPGVLYG